MGVLIIEISMEQIGEIHHGNPNNKYFHGFKRGISSRRLAAALSGGQKVCVYYKNDPEKPPGLLRVVSPQ